MIEWVVGYTLWSLGTGIAAYFNVFKPILNLIANVDGIDLSGVPEFERPVTSAIVIILTSTLFAPLIFIPSLFGPDKEFIAQYIDKIVPEDVD